MANEFSLKLDYRDNRTEIIVCTKLGLNISVIPPTRTDYVPSSDMFVIFGRTYQYDASGKMDNAKTIHYAFELMNPDGPSSHRWSMALFYDAIQYYYDRHLSMSLDGLEKGSHEAQWLKFTEQPSHEIDIFECIAPGHEAA